MKAKIFYFFLLFAILFSCKEASEGLTINIPDTTKTNVALILCEGLWGYNNSSISKLNLVSLQIQNNFTSVVNENFKIGDTGNDIAVKGDTFFVVVTTSRVLEYFDVYTGKLLGYITFEGNTAPRHIAIVNDSIVCITDLYKDCVYFVNLLKQRVENIVKVGPAPEFVEYLDGKLYVTNSGYGDYRANEPKAGTLSVIDVKNLSEIANIQLRPNPIEIAIDNKRQQILVSYNHLPSMKDSIGGILLLDAKNLNLLKEWKIQSKSLKLDETNNQLYFISENKVMKLDLFTGEMKQILSNPNKNEIWYSVAFDTKRNFLLIGNAKNYTVEGEILVYQMNNSKVEFVKSLPTGVNPSEILIVK